MKFPGTCIVCNETIQVNQVGLWSKGIGVKHEECAKVKELVCIVCGNSAGCSQCEFRNDCDLEQVSQSCICKKCSENNLVFPTYQKSVAKKYPALKT